MKKYNHPQTNVLLMYVYAQMLVDSGSTLNQEDITGQPGTQFGTAPRHL